MNRNMTVSEENLFYHNSGTVAFVGGGNYANQISLSSNNPLYNLANLRGHNSGHLAFNSEVTVENDLTVSPSSSGSALNVGTVFVHGDVYASAAAGGGTAVIRLVGSSDQTVLGVRGSTLPNLEIASTGGVVTLSGTVEIARNLNHISGSVLADGSTLVFAGGSFNNSTITSNGLILDNLELEQGSHTNFYIVDEVEVLGNLTLNSVGGNAVLNSGSVHVHGDVIKASSISGAGGGLKIVFVGSNDQTLSGNDIVLLPSLEIAKSGGTLTIAGRHRIARDFTYVSGNVDLSDSTLDFSANSGHTHTTITANGLSFHHLEFSKSSHSNVTVIDEVEILGNLTLNNTGSTVQHISGTYLLHGDLVRAGSSSGGGGALIRLIGNTDQNITGNENYSLPDLEIASTGGVVRFSDRLRLTRGFTYTSGNVDLTGSTLWFDGSTSATLVANGLTVHHLELNKSSHSNFFVADEVEILGDLILNNTSSNATQNSGTYLLHGNLSSSGSSGGGAASIKLVGSGSQTYTHTGGVLPWGDFSVEKTGGVFTLNSNLSLNGSGQNMNLVSGDIEMNGYNLTVNSALTLEAGTSLSCSGGSLSYGSLSNSGTLNCP